LITRFKALRSLRWNYTRKGVWVWLKGRQCWTCGGEGTIDGKRGRPVFCPACKGSPKRGWQRILSEPKQVLAEQTAVAEGVMG
jgi:DnaJ-class molecular chaperone